MNKTMSTGRDELFGSFISIKSPLEVLREFLISKRPFGYETFVSENFRLKDLQAGRASKSCRNSAAIPRWLIWRFFFVKIPLDSIFWAAQNYWKGNFNFLWFRKKKMKNQILPREGNFQFTISPQPKGCKTILFHHCVGTSWRFRIYNWFAETLFRSTRKWRKVKKRKKGHAPPLPTHMIHHQEELLRLWLTSRKRVLQQS